MKLSERIRFKVFSSQVKWYIYIYDCFKSGNVNVFKTKASSSCGFVLSFNVKFHHASIPSNSLEINEYFFSRLGCIKLIISHSKDI